VEWLSPWEPHTDSNGTFREELYKEVAAGHPLYKVPVQLLARGNGDDCLFELLDGSSRVAVVHLVWQGLQAPPWPSSCIYETLDNWRSECMQPEHEAWRGE
jgi:hypothetical protein